jgi:uncharacterized membrane protein YphA (DoxX/SURF4 family)
MKKSDIRHILTRLGIAVVFVSIGMWEIIQPSYWSFYMPQFLSVIASTTTLTMIHGVAMLAIGLAVLLGIYVRIASALATLMMVFIVADLVIFFGFNDIVIRDIAILIMALSLFFDDTRWLALKKKW